MKENIEKPSAVSRQTGWQISFSQTWLDTLTTRLDQVNSEGKHCILSYTFRAFDRHFYPKRLTIRRPTFVERILRGRRIS